MQSSQVKSKTEEIMYLTDLLLSTETMSADIRIHIFSHVLVWNVNLMI